MIEKYIYYRGKIVFKFEYHLFFYDCEYPNPEVNTNLHAQRLIQWDPKVNTSLHAQRLIQWDPEGDTNLQAQRLIP